MSNPVFAILPSVAIIIVFVPLGYVMDRKFTDKFRTRVSQSLEHHFIVGENNSPKLFIEIFDGLFRTRSKLRPSLPRSIIASISTTLVIAMLWAVSPQFKAQDIGQITVEADVAVVLIILFISINVAGDFFSLWLSRYLIGRMSTVRKLCRSMGYLMVDFLSSIAIFIVFLFVGALFGALLLSYYFRNDTSILSVETDQPIREVFGDVITLSLETTIEGTQELLEGGLLFCSEVITIDILAIFFFTTLLTSIWVWIFIMGVSFWPLLTSIRSVLRVRKYPIGSATMIGSVALCILVTIVLVAVDLSKILSC